MKNHTPRNQPNTKLNAQTGADLHCHTPDYKNPKSIVLITPIYTSYFTPAFIYLDPSTVLQYTGHTHIQRELHFYLHTVCMHHPYSNYVYHPNFSNCEHILLILMWYLFVRAGYGTVCAVETIFHAQ